MEDAADRPDDGDVGQQPGGKAEVQGLRFSTNLAYRRHHQSKRSHSFSSSEGIILVLGFHKTNLKGKFCATHCSPAAGSGSLSTYFSNREKVLESKT